MKKPLTAFHKNKSMKDGLCHYCKDCGKIRRHKYYIDNKEQTITTVKKWKSNNKEKYKEYCKQWHADFYEKNPEYFKQWIIDNPEKVKKYYQKYRINNPEKIAFLNAKYRGLKKEQTPILTEEEQTRIDRLYEICGHLNYNGVEFHVDHIQPISKGGLHHPDNLQILPDWLNVSKSGKWPLNESEQIKYKGFRI